MHVPIETLKILVVDDDKDITFYLSSLLKLLGHQVATATDGSSAIKIAEEFSPELILLDLELPGQSGFDVCKLIRGGGNGHSVLIFSLTEEDEEDLRREAIGAGFDGHLRKPLATTQLENVILDTSKMKSQINR